MRVDGKDEAPRQAMAWLHTWASLILGWLLYAIFVTGTLSFFQNEITVWMKPEVHQSLPPASQVTQVQTALNFLQNTAPNASAWNISLPSSKQTTTELNIRGQHEDPNARRGGERITIDAATGEQIKARETRGGGFLYRFHFELYGLPRLWARWIVGVATLLMLVAIISGVITHKKIFKDFFTFRSGKGQRSWLDAHNVTAVLALPFHIMITFSGLLLLMHLYMPWGISTLYSEGRGQFLQAQRSQMLNAPDEARSERTRQRPNKDTSAQASEPKPLTDLAPLVIFAQQKWTDNPVGSIRITYPNTAKSKIEIRALYADSVLHRSIVPTLTFNGQTGALISEQSKPNISIPAGIYNAMTVLHEGRGLDLGLRWLLFISSIFGTMMVATGLVLWCVKRAPQQQKQGYKSFGFRLVENLNIATIIGLPLAIASYFYANRLLPIQIENRSAMEIKVFLWVWLLSLIYATLRPAKQAWLELLFLSSILYALIPWLNFMTDGRALWSSIYQQQWMVATFDLMCLVLAALFLFSFFKVKNHKSKVKVARPVKTQIVKRPMEGEAS